MTAPCFFWKLTSTSTPFPVSTSSPTLISRPRDRFSSVRSVIRFPSTLINRCSLTDSPPHPQHLEFPSSRIDSHEISENGNLEAVEAELEKAVYRCRFFAIIAVFGSLLGSFLCFVKGCFCVMNSFQAYIENRAKVIMLLVEAIDTYLLGTVMLVFGIGLYELFVCNIDTAKLMSGGNHSSSFFGLFPLKERPKWLEIKSVNELKTKVGHVIVMLLLIGFFEKSKTAAIRTPMDLLFFSASVLLCAGCLYLLSRLSEPRK